MNLSDCKTVNNIIIALLSLVPHFCSFPLFAGNYKKIVFLRLTNKVIKSDFSSPPAN